MIKSVSYSINELVPYINWLYFFHAWGFPPRFSKAVEIHQCVGCEAAWVATFSPEEQAKAKEALSLYKEASKVLSAMKPNCSTLARFGVFEANSEGDNLLIYQEGDRLLRLPLLRQQVVAQPHYPHLCLSDFIRPLSQGVRDQLGVFATTISTEMTDLYELESDDYTRLLIQTLSDRLAEATAELMHEQVRKVEWGYAPDEEFTPSELHKEPFQGIRPAVGYPSLPDQTINFLLNDVLDYGAIGISLTENGAMKPHASVSGLMFAHPKSRYFMIGKIGEDQLIDYAARCGKEVDEVRRFLAPNLN